MRPAIGLLEFASIAVGIQAGDAMVKRAPLDAIYAGTVEPGKYLVLVGGMTASVEESMDAGRAVGAAVLVDEMLLPDVHPMVVSAIAGERLSAAGEALGVIETATVSAVVEAADAGVKAAEVDLLELRLADDLGGKGYLLFGGTVAAVEAAVEAGVGRVPGEQLVARVVIPQAHGELMGNLEADGRFGARTHGLEG